jgi:hypothetical protein
MMRIERLLGRCRDRLSRTLLDAEGGHEWVKAEDKGINGCNGGTGQQSTDTRTAEQKT